MSRHTFPPSSPATVYSGEWKKKDFYRWFPELSIWKSQSLLDFKVIQPWLITEQMLTAEAIERESVKAANCWFSLLLTITKSKQDWCWEPRFLTIIKYEVHAATKEACDKKPLNAIRPTWTTHCPAHRGSPEVIIWLAPIKPAITLCLRTAGRKEEWILLFPIRLASAIKYYPLPAILSSLCLHCV